MKRTILFSQSLSIKTLFVSTEAFQTDLRESMMLLICQPTASNAVLCRIRLILKFNIIKVNKIVKFLALMDFYRAAEVRARP